MSSLRTATSLRGGRPRRAGARAAGRLAALLLALPALGCVRFVAPPGVSFATTPPGAAVLLDGEECGYVTPCLIALDEDDAHAVELVLEGYQPARLRLLPGRDVHFVTWGEGQAYPIDWAFPLFLPSRALFFPMRADDRLYPSRVHVRLRPLEAE